MFGNYVLNNNVLKVDYSLEHLEKNTITLHEVVKIKYIEHIESCFVNWGYKKAKLKFQICINLY